MKILITGFEPYWDYPENSSWVVAEEVAARGVPGVDIVAELMPVSFQRAPYVLREVVEISVHLLLFFGATECAPLLG